MLFCYAQKNVASENDSIPKAPKKYSLRVGFDGYKLGRTFLDDQYRGIEFIGDFRISNKKYLAAEIGSEEITVNDDRLNFTTTGSYLKAGIDFNLYENWLDMENLIFLGFRYGFTSFSHKLNSFKTINSNNYLGENPPFESGQKFDNLTAHWLEVMLGLKAEIVSNLFLGFNVRIHRLVQEKKPENFNNLHISGFGRVSEGNKFGAGFSYTISYQFPIYKK